jgi:N6-L-threonylcarbamoyladenine synthase
VGEKFVIIGIDTSCYTTSLAVVDSAGRIDLDSRKLLRVEPGAKGLRQSDAVFQHVQNLPQLLPFDAKIKPIAAVIASVIPRPVGRSYLPVFNVGASFGETLAKMVGVPFWRTSHQEGHIRAGLYQQAAPDGPFLAWHISGGTSELLHVTPEDSGYTIKKIGGSTDLHVGQFVDRIGVALGAPFPAGPYLEELALRSDRVKSGLPVAVKGLQISFSGPASAAERMIAKGGSGPEIAWQVFISIGRSLWKVTLEAVREYQIPRVLLVGGVASNSIIRQELLREGEKAGVTFIFAPPNLSSDNAAGVGLIGWDRIKKEGNVKWRKS